MRTIIFDIETQNTFDEVGSSDPADLDISVVCIHDSEDNEYKKYEQHELDELWKVLESADLLIGYNSLHFDLPLLNKYYLGDLYTIPHLDLLKEIRESLGRRIRLDDVAKATLGTKKSADGLQAVLWWKQGNIEDIIKYCIQDVKVTKGVYDFACENGFLLYPKEGSREKIPLPVDKWPKEGEESEEKGGMTMGLGF